MKPVVAALPDGEPNEYDTAEEAVLHMQSELIGQGKNPHMEVVVAVPIGGNKVAIIRMSLDEAHKLDQLIKGYE